MHLKFFIKHLFFNDQFCFLCLYFTVVWHHLGHSNHQRVLLCYHHLYNSFLLFNNESALKYIQVIQLFTLFTLLIEFTVCWRVDLVVGLLFPCCRFSPFCGFPSFSSFLCCVAYPPSLKGWHRALERYSGICNFLFFLLLS